MREAQALGISLFAGEAEDGRLDEVLRDAWNGTLKPLYNYMDELPALAAASRRRSCRSKHVRRTSGSLSSIDLGRGCPYQCSFCTIINVQGRKSRFRSPDDLERIVRENYAQGIKRFFITDDNFARNSDWEVAVRPPDRAARRRGHEHRLHHPGGHALPQDPELHREGGAGRRAPRLHRAGEHQPGQPDRGQEAPEQDHRIPRDAAEVARPRRHHLRRLHHRLSRRHQGIDPARHRDHQARTAARHSRVLLPDAAARLGGPQERCWQRASGWTPTSTSTTSTTASRTIRRCRTRSGRTPIGRPGRRSTRPSTSARSCGARPPASSAGRARRSRRCCGSS